MSGSIFMYGRVKSILLTSGLAASGFAPPIRRSLTTSLWLLQEVMNSGETPSSGRYEHYMYMM